MSAISLIQPDRDLFSWPQYWAACFGPAPFLPMSREEMDQLGWDSCDIILVTGDAYVDHPSFGMAICGRMLEAQGFRVGIISQPDWNSKDDFMRLGKPNLFFGVTAGNMDSMINRYTADRRLRHDDAYTPDNVAGIFTLAEDPLRAKRKCFLFTGVAGCFADKYRPGIRSRCR